MNILIDAHMVGEKETGNETYVVNLIRGLQSLNPDDSFLLATADETALADQVELSSSFRPVPVSASPFKRLLREIPALVKKENVDLVHVTYAGPPRLLCPLISTVHDISYRHAPEWFSPRDRAVLELGVGATIRRCAKVLTISDYSRQEIQRVYSVPDSRIERIWLASSHRFSPDPVPDEAERREQLVGKQPYLLAVGNLQPRKNLLRTVEAFALARQQASFEHQLVLVGKTQWKHEAIQTLVHQHQLEDVVQFTGYVEDEDLPLLYRGADAFIYPSLYEGFGLPVLEAMACGTPVICSDRTSLPEVGGDAPRYINPEDVSEIADAVSELLTRPDLRPAMVEAGLKQASRFSWKETARQTLKVYHEVVQKRT